MLTWTEFQQARPDLAAAGRSQLYQWDVGLGFLATVRVDGGPRVHPICPVLNGDGLYALIVPGPKLYDLRRDPRYALHTDTRPPPRHDDGFYITGSVKAVEDPTIRRRVVEQFVAERAGANVPAPDETQVLYEFLLDRALLTLTLDDGGLPQGHTVWSA